MIVNLAVRNNSFTNNVHESSADNDNGRRFLSLSVQAVERPESNENFFLVLAEKRKRGRMNRRGRSTWKEMLGYYSSSLHRSKGGKKRKKERKRDVSINAKKLTELDLNLEEENASCTNKFIH